VRAAFGVAAPVPVRARSAEAKLRGKRWTPELADEFAEAIQADIRPRTSWRAPEDFRRHIAGELAARALRESVRMAREGGAR